MTEEARSPVGEVTVAVLQLSSQENVAENLRLLDLLVRAAAAAGAGLVVLPENFAYMGPENGKREIAEPLGAGSDAAPIQAAVRSLARREHVSIVAGGFPERSTDPVRPHNTSFAVNQHGELVASYRKIHLFDVDLGSHGTASESSSTLAGSAVVTADLLGFCVGLSICYDLRFPELYRALSDRGAELLTVPAAFTLYTGKDHWHVLLRARAIEAQCYVAAAAQWGKHPEGRATFGHALIVDPWGSVIAEASDRVGFACARIERSFLTEIRKRVPSLRHRRLP